MQRIVMAACAMGFILLPEAGLANSRKEQPVPMSGEQLYKLLSAGARGEGPGAGLPARLLAAGRQVDWSVARDFSVLANLRKIEGDPEPLYLVRSRTADIYVLSLPKDSAELSEESGSPYAGLSEMVKHKMTFHLQIVPHTIDGVRYGLVRLRAPPVRSLLDRAFFVAIVLVLFLTMVGMGVTLTVSDFAAVFRKPVGIIVGLVCQFGLMPLAAMALGILAGFHQAYPFIYLGMILVAASPGGVISNLMTYLGKGDVALSVSLTAVCTVLAFVGTPLLLTLYASNLPDFTVPADDVFKTMLVLVIVPLGVGMILRRKTPALAKKLEKPLAGLGVFALLFLIGVGVWGNADALTDTSRYGFKFYGLVLCLTLTGMLLGGASAKLFKISNFQARAISLEVGLRNASLSMTIAILLQDRVGDFASAMFVTSGVFGICMYLAGALTIFGFRFLLPVQPSSGG